MDAVSLNNEGLAAVRAQIGHSYLVTIYPAGAQLVFALVTLTAQPLIALKLLTSCCFLASTYVLIRLCNDSNIPAGYASLYGLCPMICFEAVVGAHIDFIALFLLIAGLYYFRLNRYASAGFILGVS